MATVAEKTGTRTSDSDKGKSCHQCRQKTMDVMVSCKKMKKNKLCTMTYCQKCLSRRYGLEAKEVGKLEDWNCPKCEGVCNCSVCMRNKGFLPTGSLQHESKENGIKSVQELLEHEKGSLDLNYIDVMKVSCTTPDSSSYKKNLAASKRSYNKDIKNKKNNGSEKINCNLTVESEAYVADNARPKHHCKSFKSEKLAEVPEETSQEDIVLPQVRCLEEITGVKFPPQDVGRALQFLNFCKSFAKVLDIEKEQPEHVLRDLINCRIGCRELSSPVVRFHIKLLSLFEENINDENWVQSLGRLITKSRCPLENLCEDTFDKGISGYDTLEPLEKLKILNFLCEETLGTKNRRNCINEENTKFYDEMEEIKLKVLAIREEEKLLRQVRDDIGRALGGALLSLSEHNLVSSGIRTQK